MRSECDEDSGYKGATGQTAKEGIAEGIYRFGIGIRKSIRYHAKRRRFFDNLHHLTDAVVAISGSSAFAALWSGDSSHTAIWFSASAAIAAALDLIIGFAKCSRLHDDLVKRFSRLLNETITQPHSDEALTKWQAARVAIEEDEPTFLALLVAICENEELLARGHHGYVLKRISFWRRWLADWISFDSYHERLLSKHHPA